MNQWLKDFRWALNAMRARRLRRELTFSKRQTFDRLLRPDTGRGDVIAYPDAFYCITLDDVHRAYLRAQDFQPTPMRRPARHEGPGEWMS
jgi:hypothetical protein